MSNKQMCKNKIMFIAVTMNEQNGEKMVPWEGKIDTVKDQGIHLLIDNISAET